jgi:hypothetical protein
MTLRTFLITAVVSLLAMPSQLSAGDRYVRTSAELQSALGAAQPGDRILLEPGVTYLGNFVLPAKSGTTFITIRSATPDAMLPPNGTRISPSSAALLPRLQSPNSLPALRTAAGAHHWRLQYLEFGPNKDGAGDVIQLGDSAQTSLASVPYALELLHIYVHGDRLLGQKRGIALNAGGVVIRDSHISDCKSVAQDAQAIAGWNGPGPYLIENNYLEGAGDNFMLGGADPAIPGLIPTDVTFRRNYVSRPANWRDPIIAAPSGVAATGVPGAGILAAGTYAYRVVARRPSGQGTTGRSTASVQATAVLTSNGGAVQVQWSAVPDAVDYLVYGRTAASMGMYWKVTATSFVDTGGAGTAGAVPTSKGTVWQVKNLFELKNARRVLVEWNTFENNWQAGQAGYAILLTPRNSNNTCTWCAIEDVEFRYNIVRHSAAVFNMLGYDGTAPSGQLRNVRIHNNLFYDISSAQWGGNGWGFLIGEAPRDVIIDHNTIDHSGTTLLYAYGGTATDPREIFGLEFTNNLARHNASGINASGQSYGYPAINAYFPDGFITANLLAGGTPSRYPPGNFFGNDFNTQFVNRANGDYRLIPTSAYNTGSTDGQPLGANIETLMRHQPAPPGAVAPPPGAPAPVATSLSPASANAGTAAFNLIVNGSNFVSSSIVRWNGANRPTTFLSATQLRASIAAADIATAGSASVTVFTPAPGGGTSAQLTFTIAQVASGPQLTVNRTTVPPGGSVTVTLTNGPGGIGDWLAFARTTAPDAGYETYTYVGLGVSTRTWTVTTPTTPGTYEFRLFLNNGYVRVATSPTVTVQ